MSRRLLFLGDGPELPKSLPPVLAMFLFVPQNLLYQIGRNKRREKHCKSMNFAKLFKYRLLAQVAEIKEKAIFSHMYE